MSRSWLPAAPVFRAIDLVDAVVADVRRGRLRPGDTLPGSRALAASLGLNRKTVVSALAELEAEGWIEQSAGRRARVRADLPPSPVNPARRLAPGVAATLPPPQQVPPRPPGPRPLALAGGQPDLRLLPMSDLARAWRRALRGPGRALADYGSPLGDAKLREVLGDWLAATRGVRPAPEGLLVTRGAQNALFLAASTLLRRGDRVAVEAWGYSPAWDAFRAAGLELVPVPVDGDGIVVDEIPAARAVYVTPHHQYPTGVVLTPGRRAALLDLARRRDMLVIEDDYDHEFHYTGRPVLPLAAQDPEPVVYVGTLSKAFAPGLRVGFVATHPARIAALAAFRRVVDRQGDHVTERAVAELLLDGTVDRHLRRCRRVYQRRRTTLRAALAAQFGTALVPNDPPGGLAFWTEAPGIDVDCWAARALANGVEITTARRYAFGGEASPWVRLGYAGLDESELVEAVARLRRGW